MASPTNETVAAEALPDVLEPIEVNGRGAVTLQAFIDTLTKMRVGPDEEVAIFDMSGYTHPQSNVCILRNHSGSRNIHRQETPTRSGGYRFCLGTRRRVRLQRAAFFAHRAGPAHLLARRRKKSCAPWPAVLAGEEQRRLLSAYVRVNVLLQRFLAECVRVHEDKHCGF